MRRPDLERTGRSDARQRSDLLYFRRVFRDSRLGRLLPFLFIWQFVFSGPMEIAFGFIGFAQYLGYFWRSMGPWETRLAAMAVGVLVVALLYRQITAVARLTVVLWVGMMATVLWIIASGLMNFVALGGWVYVFLAAGTTCIVCGLLVMAVGVAAFLVWNGGRN